MNQMGSSVSKKLTQYTTSTFNISVITRILISLQEKGRINRTNLAGIAGLNYRQCIKYVSLLNSLDWICVTFDEGYHIVITEKGIEMVKKLAKLA